MLAGTEYGGLLRPAFGLLVVLTAIPAGAAAQGPSSGAPVGHELWRQSLAGLGQLNLLPVIPEFRGHLELLDSQGLADFLELRLRRAGLPFVEQAPEDTADLGTLAVLVEVEPCGDRYAFRADLELWQLLKIDRPGDLPPAVGPTWRHPSLGTAAPDGLSSALRDELAVAVAAFIEDYRSANQ